MYASYGYDGDLPQNCKFTGKERDSESGLDNFGARYMASTMGRFMSADPFTVTPGRVVDPQQLNLYAYVRNNPLRHIDPTGMLIDDAACKQDMKHCGKDWQKVQDIANQQDKNGNYLHPELHNELTTLQNDSRTFTIENSSLGAGTAGQFTITNFTADGKDFTKATLQLDFKQIKGISGVTGADLVPGFNKYQGLLDSPIYRLAETFGHEGAHGLFSIQNPAQAVGIQQLPVTVPNLFFPYVIGDFNGDGKLDIASGPGVFLNTGNRTFQEVAGTVPLDNGVQAVVADFNGDGKDDIALITPGSTPISIWYGRGDGTFYEGTLIDPGQYAGGIAVGDFNGDGRPDIVVGLEFSHQVCIFFNSGNGQFTRSFFASGADTIGMIATDMNRDGNPDLVIGNFVLSFEPANVDVVFHK